MGVSRRGLWPTSPIRVVTDAEVERVVGEGPVRAVLLRTRRWLSADRVELRRDATLWRVELQGADGASWHTVFTCAEDIVGISIDRTAQLNLEAPGRGGA